MDFHTPVVEVMVYVESEKRYFELRKQIVSQMADMIGKLKKLGYGGPAIPLLPCCSACAAPHVLLQPFMYASCSTCKTPCRHDLVVMMVVSHADMENLDMDDQRMPPDVRAWLRKYQRHTEMREKLAEMKAKLYGEPKPGASEKLGAELAAAASRKETLRSRTGTSLQHFLSALSATSSVTNGLHHIELVIICLVQVLSISRSPALYVMLHSMRRNVTEYACLQLSWRGVQGIAM